MWAAVAGRVITPTFCLFHKMTWGVGLAGGGGEGWVLRLLWLRSPTPA